MYLSCIIFIISQLLTCE